MNPRSSSQLSIPSPIFFFGLAGVGKSHVARVISSRLGYHHYEFEQDLTPAMLQSIAEGEPFTDAMRNEYFSIVSTRLHELCRQYPEGLVVSQAAYKERHRTALKSEHPTALFIWVTAPDDRIAERISMRGNYVTPELARTMARGFEHPSQDLILLNDVDDDDALFERFLELVSTIPAPLD